MMTEITDLKEENKMQESIVENQENMKQSESSVIESSQESQETGTPLMDVEPGTYTVKKIDTDDEDMNGFLFHLGCYSGEEITLVSKKKKSCLVVIKDGRYSIDNVLASAILV